VGSKNRKRPKSSPGQQAIRLRVPVQKARGREKRERPHKLQEASTQAGGGGEVRKFLYRPPTRKKKTVHKPPISAACRVLSFRLAGVHSKKHGDDILPITGKPYLPKGKGGGREYLDTASPSADKGSLSPPSVGTPQINGHPRVHPVPNGNAGGQQVRKKLIGV